LYVDDIVFLLDNLRMNNKNRERFLKLTNKRVNGAINQIRLVGNLSDKRYYNYSEEEAKLLLSAIRKELKKTEERFLSSKRNSEKNFNIEDVNK
tara:strand:+ start:221 stop:502 length:282 start_codon:yes stop_codon:yes gene_type:complete